MAGRLNGKAEVLNALVNLYTGASCIVDRTRRDQCTLG